MNDVERDFRARVKEVLLCMSHVGALSVLTEAKAIDTARAMRATVYLVLYNMIESTARNAVCSIFDHLRDEMVAFDDIRPELKVFVLTHARSRNPAEFAVVLRSVATDLLVEAFDEDLLFSGNVDAKQLKKTAKQIGYEAKVAADGSTLLAIKSNRNDLAHGHKTFTDIGRDVSVTELRSHAARAIWYMRGVLRNISAYTMKKQYLASNSL